MFCLYQLFADPGCVQQDDSYIDLPLLVLIPGRFAQIPVPDGRASILLWSVCGISSPISSNRIVPWLANSNLPAFRFWTHR